MCKCMTIRQLQEKKENLATYLFINSLSPNVKGTSNNYNVDITKLPLQKNKSYNWFIKQVYYPSAINQLQNKYYNYNKIYIEVLNRTTQAVVGNQSMMVTEGTYDTTQLATSFISALNNFQTSSSFGGDQYTMSYSDITNKYSIKRLTQTAVGGVYYDIRICSNDSFSFYNGMPGFGLSWILGCNNNTVFNLGTSAGFTVEFPNPPCLNPFQYFFITMNGLNNINFSTDINQRNDMIMRCPLNMSSSKYGYFFIEEANQEFSQLYMSTLTQNINIQIIDQYANPLQLSNNTEIDITFKLVSTE